MSKSSRELREQSPAWLTLHWCDRCDRLVNDNEEPDHFHHEQCGGCLKFKAVDGDWGYCRSHTSVYAGRRMSEHDSCRHWMEGEW